MSSEATSDHGAGGDQAVWVHDYTTSTGVAVPGHWRKKAHRDSGGDTGADVGSGSGGGREGLTGDVGVRTAEATSGVATGVRPGAGRVQGMPAPDERVSAGLQALRQRRELLAQANPAGPSSAPGATGNHSGGRVKCSTCGQFKGDQHTCTAGSGVVVDPTAAAAAEGVVDRHGDVQVTEYVPYSGRTAWSVAGPQGRYLVTPDGKGSFLVWKSDSITDGRTCPDVDGGIRTAASLATDLPAGRPGSESWNAKAAETIAAIPSGETHVFEAVRSRDGSQLSQELLVSHHSSEEGFGRFSVDGPGSSGLAMFSYGGGTGRTREEAAQAAAREAGREQQPQQCDDCGQFMSFEKPHECPAAARVLANQPAATPTASEPEEDEGAAATPAEPEVPEAPDGLPAGDYADLKGDARTKAMIADLEDSVKAVVESGQLGAWLGAMATNGMTRWSFNNQMLAMIQMAFRGKDLDGLHMMGFRQWEKLNRKVSKGAKAVWILAPMTRKFVEEDDDGTRREKVKTIGFKSVPVFDISDTHGDPLPASPVVPPTGEATPGTLEGLRDRVGQAGYTYEEVKIPGCNPATGDGTQGYTDPQSKKVVVDSRLPGAMKASVIAHELGHIHCGHVDGDYSEYQRHRGRMETEAEMTSFLTMRARGASKEQSESFAAGYIAAWSKGDAKIIHGAVDKAVRAHNKILDGEWPSS